GPEGRLHSVRELQGQLARRCDALGHETRRGHTAAFSEQVDEGVPVGSADRLAPWHVRQGWMAAVEATAADADVERVEGDPLDLDQDLAPPVPRLGGVGPP